MASNINADNGVVSGSAGLKTSADSSGVLALQTNGTTAVTIDTAQNVGIGVTLSNWSVAYQDILQTKGGSIFGDPAGSEGNLGVNVYYNSGYKYAADGYVSIYQQYNAQHIFKTSVIGTTGNAVSLTNSLAFGKGTTLALEGATTQTGTGITFPATQSASSNANTLDDYEEGTFTPTFGGSVSDPTVSYSTQIGTYTKVGRVVTATINLNPSSYSGGSGNLYLKGLPFTSSVAGTGAVYTSGVNWSTKTQCTVYTPAGGNTYLRLLASGSNVTDYDVIVSDVSATDPIICTITYFTST